MTSTSTPFVATTDLQHNTTKKHIRGSSLLLVGRMVSVALSFSIQILTVRYLSKNNFGAFAYALVVVEVGSRIVLVGLDKAVTRFIPIYHEQHDYRMMFGTIIMTLGTILGLGGSMLLLVFGLQGVVNHSFVGIPQAMSGYRKTGVAPA